MRWITFIRKIIILSIFPEYMKSLLKSERTIMCASAGVAVDIGVLG